VGAAFVLAPSGWLVRLIAAPLGLTTPPAFAYGAGYDLLVLGAVLVLKETPFLVAVLVAVARERRGPPLPGAGPEPRLRRHGSPPQAPGAAMARPLEARGRCRPRLRHRQSWSWPSSWVRPPRPSCLCWSSISSHPDLKRRLDGSAAALLLIALTGLGYVTYRVGHKARRPRLQAPGSPRAQHPGLTRWLARIGDSATTLLLAFLALTVVVLALWSLAGPWRFPDPLPATLHLDLWQRRAPLLLAHAGTTALIAVTTALIALAVVLLWLETTGRTAPPVWLWLPLVVPQIAFLFGLQVLLLILGLAPASSR
jgi:putative thiamine transport system permease protein